MNGEGVFIVGMGASTPVGRDAWSSAAAVRAGVSAFAQHPYMIDTAGESMRAAFAPWLEPDLNVAQRFESLLFPAIDQALEPLGGSTSTRLALALALPAPRVGLPSDFQATLLAAIGARYRRTFSAVAGFPNGHAAGLLALEAATLKLASAGLDACVVAGVDSYLEPETLEWLEACDQLHGTGQLNNAWGFVPGEAAGALLLARQGITGETPSAQLARVLGVGTGTEPHQIKTQTVCTGEGLTRAFRSALQALPSGQRVTDVYCDLNGEPYRADEYAFATLRTKEAFESASDFIAPADCWGDVGAASGPLHVALAAIAGRKRYAAGPTAFVWGSSESGERATVLLRVASHN